MRKRRVVKIVVWVLAVLVGVPAAGIAALLLWDGGIDTDPRRELTRGVQINLRTVTTRLGPVEYDLYGTEGPVLLSLHGGLGGADQGRLFASWLQEDGFRVLSPSRPGYLGTPLDSGRTHEEQADLLAALLDELGIDRVGVLAVSAGSPVGYTFAARHPDRVWGLVSVGGVSKPQPGGAGSSLRRAFLTTVGQKLTLLTAKVSFETIVSGTLEETSSFTEEQQAERVSYIVNTPHVRTFFEAMFTTTFPYPERWPGTDNDAAQARRGALPLERITTPTLLIHGRQDGDVPFDHGEFAAERIPGARRHWMEHEDHLGFWLSPEASQVQAVARAFLREHAPGD
ncbi:pimeloyl-ACP methyl ester carboxylesterase [Nonomuraea polychroma]|uniref:Pimeloyl-ACP methyl ester carboxylesterase n=1 Tax=Nonomuraea polychroma TaxID=46176 RepID=A0A438MD90_9ACTN|nr:alpha/beta hydrolase [Nonomuraea polychroma]RVX43760.1 pimeloyl-ACP methyl ester carboxylesterase [Nonomuraea polychroma]